MLEAAGKKAQTDRGQNAKAKRIAPRHRLATLSAVLHVGTKQKEKNTQASGDQCALFGEHAMVHSASDKADAGIFAQRGQVLGLKIHGDKWSKTLQFTCRT